MEYLLLILFQYYSYTSLDPYLSCSYLLQNKNPKRWTGRKIAHIKVTQKWFKVTWSGWSIGGDSFSDNEWRKQYLYNWLPSSLLVRFWYNGWQTDRFTWIAEILCYESQGAVASGGDTLIVVVRVWCGLISMGEFMIPSSFLCALLVRSNNARTSKSIISK